MCRERFCSIFPLTAPLIGRERVLTSFQYVPMVPIVQIVIRASYTSLSSSPGTGIPFNSANAQ